MGFFQTISAVKTAIQIASSAMFIAADIADFTDNVIQGAKAGWKGEPFEEEPAPTSTDNLQRKPSEVARAAHKIAQFVRHVVDAVSELLNRNEEDADGPVQLSLLDNIVPIKAAGDP
jgi:hypothetical protein